jgi:hypothetical protein
MAKRSKQPKKIRLPRTFYPIRRLEDGTPVVDRVSPIEYPQQSYFALIRLLLMKRIGTLEVPREAKVEAAYEILRRDLPRFDGKIPLVLIRIREYAKDVVRVYPSE